MAAGLLMRAQLPGGTRASGWHRDADTKQQTSRGRGLASGADTSTHLVAQSMAEFQQTLNIADCVVRSLESLLMHTNQVNLQLLLQINYVKL